MFAPVAVEENNIYTKTLAMLKMQSFAKPM